MSFYDLFLTIQPPDPERLIAAEVHRAQLDEWNNLNRASCASLLCEMGENLFYVAWPTDGAVEEFANKFATAYAAGETVRLWIYAPDLQLAGLPWEFLHVPEEYRDIFERLNLDLGAGFLELHPHMIIVRRSLPQFPGDGPLPLGKLRILVAWACPNTWDRIDGIDREAALIGERLRERLESGHYELQELPHATTATLERALRDFRPHVLHYAGHGIFPLPGAPADVIEPSLVLESNSHGAHAYLRAEQLRRLCEGHGPVAVFLNCCWGARAPGHARGMAQALAGPSPEESSAPVCVVVANQAEVPQYAAAGLAASLYAGLAGAQPVETAVHEWRTGLVRSHKLASSIPDWGLPVVFLNRLSSVFFVEAKATELPSLFVDVIQEYCPFVGREFVRREIEVFAHNRAGGIFVLTARPGVGKTAFVADWILRKPDAPCYLFRHARGYTDPQECIRSLNAALCHKYHIVNGEIDRDYRERFEARLQQVSEGCVKRGVSEWILIDAIDESRPAPGIASIFHLLPRVIPPHVYLFLTSRPGADELNALASRPDTHASELRQDSPENLVDAEEYCRRQVDSWLTDGDEAERAALAVFLAQRAHGNFLVLRHFLQSDFGGPVTRLAEVRRRAENLTESVESIYEVFFERVRELARTDAPLHDAVYAVLGAFASAFAPVEMEQIVAAFGLTLSQWDRAFPLCAQFLMQSNVHQPGCASVAYNIYHETFAEFLRDRLRHDLTRRSAAWAEHCERWRSLAGYARVYALRYLPEHLLAANDPPRAAQPLIDFEYLEANIREADIYGVLMALRLVETDLNPAHPLHSQLCALHRMLDRDADLLREDAALLPQQAYNALAWDWAPETHLGTAVRRAPTGKPQLRLAAPPTGWCEPPLLRNLKGHREYVSSLAFSRDGRVLASASGDHTVKLWDAHTGQLLQTLEGHRYGARLLAFSRDGTRLASTCCDETVKLWEARTGRLLQNLEGHSDDVRAIVFSPDGSHLASGSCDRTVKLWDAHTGRLLQTMESKQEEPPSGLLWLLLRLIGPLPSETHRGPVYSLAFSPDGAWLASGSHDHTVKLWEAPTGRLLRTLARHSWPVNSVTFSPDGARLASGSGNEVMLWDAHTGLLVRTLEGHTAVVGSVLFSPDGTRLASIDGHTVKLWDAQTGSLLRTLKGYGDEADVDSVSFSPDGAQFASGSADTTVKLWDAHTGNLLLTLEGHSNGVTSVAFSPDGARLASASRDGTVRLWNPHWRPPIKTLEGHTMPVTSVAFSPDGAQLASASTDGVKLWDTHSAGLLWTRPGNWQGATSVAFSQDGTGLAIGFSRSIAWFSDRRLEVWNPREMIRLKMLKGHGSRVKSVAFSADGMHLASGSEDHTVRLWHAWPGFLDALVWRWPRVLRVVKLWAARYRYRRTDRLFQTLEGHSNSVESVAFSLDGTCLASGSDDGAIKLWDANTGSLLHTMYGHGRAVLSVVFSPDGLGLASGSGDNTVKLWHTKTGRPLQTMEGHGDQVRSVAFSPDGTTMASGSDDGTVRLWDIRSRRELTRLPLPFRVIRVGFVGSVLLAADDGGESYHPNCYRLEIVWPPPQSS